MQQSKNIQRRKELGQFLRTRRARLSAEQLGLPRAPRKRTPGLRREEVAVAAGVSTSWYTYLEQGRDIHASPVVLSSLADVLRLTEDEREYLFTLADQPQEPGYRQSSLSTYQRVLDSLGDIPAMLTNPVYDVVGWNRAARLVFGDFELLPPEERNILKLLFLTSPASKRITLFEEQDTYAREVVETFRKRIMTVQDKPEIQNFIAQLQQESPRFQHYWAQHNVRSSCDNTKQLSHPRAGTLTLEYAKFQLVEQPEIRCHMYLAADPETAHRLRQLLHTSAQEEALLISG
uniref:Transcriptional regulator n=1 Tax=Thermosporothrix sp. COM3 TaxID=2490863 RepID=A0A455SLB4_9CHLR|nr:transcriptional regulator [Thermosporothrix sp. COM3]